MISNSSKRKISLSILVFLLFTLINTQAFAYNQNKVLFNGTYLALDVPPTIVDGRMLVPFRGIFEAFGGTVEWIPSTRTVIGSKGKITIELQLDNKTCKVNGQDKLLDVPAQLISSRTMVPLRFVSESLGAKVEWDKDTGTAEILAPTTGIFLGNKEILLNSTEEDIISKLGVPDRKDLSEYGFYWYIYNKDYSNYIQVGVKDGRVAALYSNAAGFKWNNIKIGSAQSEVTSLSSKQISSIVKGMVGYTVKNDDQSKTYLIDGYYITIFFDIHDSNKVTSLQFIEKGAEEALHGFYGSDSIELRTSYENEIFDLSNAIRVRMGKSPYKQDNSMADIARKHSADMGARKYFSHDNPDGKSPFDRMEAAGISFRLAAENIAAGQKSAIFAHEGWMNSLGHRHNILGDCLRLGVGVSFGGPYFIYYTQDFYTPR